METYQVKLEMFEGPFDLLLHLIEKNEVDIYDIPIAEITAQYLDYIDQMKELDLDVASEFLVMAATLLSIKAKMLLPKPPAPEQEEDLDPRTQLVRDLLEYKKIKAAASYLEEHYQARQKLHTRNNHISLYSGLFPESNPLEGKTLADLTEAFYRIWQQVKEEHTTIAIQRSLVSIDSMMDKISQAVRQKGDGVSFTVLFSQYGSKIHLIVGFLALLELVKNNRITLYQDHTFDDIFLFPGESLMVYSSQEQTLSQAGAFWQ